MIFILCASHAWKPRNINFYRAVYGSMRFPCFLVEHTRKNIAHIDLPISCGLSKKYVENKFLCLRQSSDILRSEFFKNISSKQLQS